MTPPTPYRPEIEVAANAHGIDADLLEAVVWQESSYHADAFRFEPAFWERYLKANPAYADKNPRRVSSSYGLAQIMYPVAVDHGFTKEPEYLFLPTVNLDLAASILAGLLKKYSPMDALASYNGGEGNRTAAAPTQYARSVLSRYDAVRAARKA